MLERNRIMRNRQRLVTPRDEDERLAAIGDEMTSRFADEEIQVRSFAAVTLAEVLARDRLIGRLSASTVLAWQDEFTRWYRSEPDLRGWDERLGWLHAVAHGADALGSFGLNAHLGTPNLVGLLALARDRLLAPTEALFANQEDDRLGYAIAVVLSRPELDAEGAVSWLEEIGRAFDSGKPGPVPAWASNTIRTLRVVYLHADRGLALPGSSPGVAATAVVHRGAVLEAVAGVLRRVWPYLG